MLEQTIDDTEQNLRRFTVFLVDDHLDDRKQARKVLEKSPYVHNVLDFETGNALMSYLKTEDFYGSRIKQRIPIVILLDIKMPGIDGMEVLRLLREHPITKSIPIILLTGDSSDTRVSEAYALEVNAYLQKPLRLSNIQDTLFSISDPSEKRPKQE